MKMNCFYSFFLLEWKSSGCLWASLFKDNFSYTLLYTSVVEEKLMRQKAYNTKMSDADINDHIHVVI